MIQKLLLAATITLTLNLFLGVHLAGNSQTTTTHPAEMWISSALR